MAAAGAEFGGEVDARDAAADEMSVGALGGGERREFFCAVDDGGKALLRIGDDSEGVGELELFLGEGHGARQMDCREAGPEQSRRVAALLE